MCEDLLLSNLTVSGAPGIDLDETSGELQDITLNGGYAGVGLTIRHGFSEPVVVEGLQITNYSIGLKLHAHDFEEPAQTILRNASINSIEAASLEYFDARFESSSLVGNISVSSSVIDAVDSTLSGSTSIDSEGMVNEWSTHSILASLNGDVVEATFTVSSNLVTDPIEFTGSFVDIEMLHTRSLADSSTSIIEATVLVLSAKSLASSEVFPIGSGSQQNVVIYLQPNTPPTLSISAPYSGQRYMETIPVEVSLTVWMIRLNLTKSY